MDWIFRRSDEFDEQGGDPERFRVIASSWLRAETDQEADLWLSLTLNTTSPFVPALAFLAIRSWPEVSPNDIRDQLLADRRVDAADALTVAVAILHDRSPAASVAALEMFRRTFRESQIDTLVALAEQTVDVEQRAVAAVLERDEPIEHLAEGVLSTPGVAVVLLGDGNTEVARAKKWREILTLSRDTVLDETRRLGNDCVRRLVRAHGAALAELANQQPRERLLVMTKRVHRTAMKRATIGEAFLPAELLAELLGNTVKSLRPRHSRSYTRVQIAWANGYNTDDRA